MEVTSECDCEYVKATNRVLTCLHTSELTKCCVSLVCATLFCLLSVHFVMSAVMLSMCNISSLPPALSYVFTSFIPPSVPPIHYREEAEEEEKEAEEPQNAELSVQGSARYSGTGSQS